jgi:hypothetical protein
MAGLIHIGREDLAEVLHDFGEDALAERIANEEKVSKEQLERIGRAAYRYSISDEYALPSGRGMMIDKALAHGAVEVLEGRERELARKRKRPRPHFANPS